MKTINVKEKVNSYCFVSYGDANAVCDEVIRIRKADKNEIIQIDFTDMAVISNGLFEHFWEQYYKEFKEKETNVTIINVNTEKGTEKIFELANDKEYKTRVEIDKYYLEHPQFASFIK